MGSGEARSSKLTARAETRRDRNGLTFPTSSAEQIATPERSLSRMRGRRLSEAEVRTSLRIRCMMIASFLATATHAFFFGDPRTDGVFAELQVRPDDGREHAGRRQARLDGRRSGVLERLDSPRTELTISFGARRFTWTWVRGGGR
jgi:hypothetical protein